MLASIRGRLLGGFLICSLLSSVAGLVGLFSVSQLGDSVSRMVQDQTPTADAAQDASLAARGVRAEIEQFLRSSDGLPPIQARAEHALSLVDLFVAMIREGTGPALAGDQRRAALAKAAGVTLNLRHPASGAILDQVVLVEKRYQEMVTAAKAAMQSHEARLKMTVRHEGRLIDLDKLLYAQRVALARWATELEEAARFGAPITVDAGRATADFARWCADFRSEDRKLMELIGAVGVTQAQLHDLVRQLEAAPAEQRLSLLERGRTRVVARAGAAFGAALDYLTPLTNRLTAEADAQAAEMLRIEGGLVDALDRLRKLVEQEVEKAKAETASIQSWSLRLALLAVVAGLAASIACAAFIGRGISRPVGDLTATMGRLASGELATEVPQQGRRDEIGEMARSVEIFRKGLTEAERLRAETREAEEAAALRAQQITELVREMEGVVLRTANEITDASGALRRTAAGATTSAAQARAQSEAASHASQTTRDRAESVAAATEELSGSIVEIGRQASLSATISESAALEMREAGQRVERLSDAADRIGDVLNLITHIAGQTNLLALNATIEAARAGEAGKGFAVVAVEVKALAHQTARATEEISQHIEAIQAETQLTAAAMRSVGGVIERARSSTVTIASAVEEQQAATTEIANNIQSVSVNSASVEANCLETDSRIVDLLANNTAVQDAADRLTHSAEDLRTEMNRFFERFRA